MSETVKSDVGRRYLLGRLSQEEEIRIEEGFIADDVDFEQLEIAEDELIDAYVNDELSTQERKQFETKLLTSQRIIDRINFARALARKAGEQPQLASDRDDVTPFLAKQKTKWWPAFVGQQMGFPTALAASVALLLIGGTFLFFSWRQLRAESERIASEREQLQRQTESTEKQLLEQQVKNEQMAVAVQKERETLEEERRRIETTQQMQSNTGGLSRTIVSLMLSPGLVRDSNAQQQATIGAGVASVQLNLLLESNDYRSYQVTIKKARGGTVFTRSGLIARKATGGHVISLLVPAKPLEPGSDYVVSVRGRLPNGAFEPVEDYVFRVSR